MSLPGQAEDARTRDQGASACRHSGNSPIADERTRYGEATPIPGTQTNASSQNIKGKRSRAQGGIPAS